MPLPFLHPWMVAGTAMGSAPVIIHLLNRQRYRRVTWAAMHWLLASFKKSSRRLQIEDLILLIIRILILVLLALALARPFLAQGGAFFGGESKRHRVVILDTSYSMSYRVEDQTAFAEAKEAARELVSAKTLNAGDAVSVIFMTDQARVRVKASSNINEVFREVDSAELSHSASDPVKSLATAIQLLQEKKDAYPRMEIFLITDMTRNGWIDPESTSGRVRGLDQLNKTVEAFSGGKGPDQKLPGVFLIDVGARSPENIAVTGLESDVNVIAAKSKVVFKARVSNYTTRARKQLPVTFKVDGKTVSSRLVDVLGGQTVPVTFFHQFERSGPHWVTASIESDRLVLDDSRSLAVPVVPSLKVLAVDGEEKSDPLESECGILSRVLSVPVTDSMVNQGITSPSIIKTQVVPDSGLADSPLDDFDLLVLANVPVVSDDKIKELQRFVHEGGALMIFVGDNVDAALYNEKFLDLKDEEGRELAPLLPCRLIEPQGEAGNRDLQKFFAFKPDDSLALALPTFMREERRSYIARPKKGFADIGVRIFKRFLVRIEDADRKAEAETLEEAEGIKDQGKDRDGGTPPRPEKSAEKAADQSAGETGKADGKPARPPRGRVSVPLSYDDGKPAVAVREYGLGKVCLITTTADTNWTDLPGKWVCLPFMHDLVYYLVRERGRDHNLEIGGEFSVRWPAEDLLKDVEVLPPEGFEEHKSTIRPEVNKKTDLTILSYPHAEAGDAGGGVRWAGAYRLTISGEGESRDIFVANLDPVESNLDRIELDELRKLIEKVRFVQIEDREKIAETLKSKFSGKEFWRNLVWAVLTLAVCETFLAWFFGRKRW